MPRGAFSSAVLQPDGTVIVKGPFSRFSEDPIKEIFVEFFLVQGAPGAEIMVDGHGSWIPGNPDWTGTADSGQLRPGPANGNGFIVLVHDDPPSFVTQSWNSPVEVTEA
jgi:cell wall assembly regulator SMI1